MSESLALARRVVARFAALLSLLLVALAPVSPAPAGTSDSRADDRASHWAGFRIPSTGHADGGWIGGYRIGTTPVFVTTPRKRPNRAGFEPASATEDLPGSGATARETARAAWILSKYGGYRDDVQAAAVDAAVLHLLVGRTWRITGNGRGAQRIRQARDSATVLRFARLMLRSSRVSAGAYGATVTASSADVGGITSVTVSVTDGRGRPVAGLPVTVTSPEGGPAVASGGPVEAVTGDDGRTLVRLAAPLAGWRTVTARIGQVPEHRLIVRAPDRRGQAAVAEGGVRRTLEVSTRAAVRGPQTLAVRAAPDVLTAGTPARVVASVVGDGTSRAVSATLHGPVSSAAAAGCSAPAVGTASGAVSVDGDYTLPPITPGAGGFYAWRVSVDGTETSLPITSCGAVAKVRARTTTTLAAVQTASENNVTVPMTVSGVPYGAKVDLMLKLFGPYESLAMLQADACNQVQTQVTVSRQGDGTVVSGPIWLPTPARYYAWQAETAPGELWLGSRSTCAAPGTVTYLP